MLIQYKSKAAPQNNKLSAMDDDVDDDDEKGNIVMRRVCYACMRVVRVCLECGAENKKIRRGIYGNAKKKVRRCYAVAAAP